MIKRLGVALCIILSLLTTSSWAAEVIADFSNDSLAVLNEELRKLQEATSSVNSSLAATVPTGIICLWSGASSAIPSGWVLCDGNNGTPDLRDRFIVGATSTYAVGATGGQVSVALSQQELPAVGISIGLFETSIFQAGSHTIPVLTNRGSSSTTANLGSGVAHENRPPYYALCYIMKT